VIPLLKWVLAALVLPLCLAYIFQTAQSFLGIDASGEELLSPYLNAYPICLGIGMACVGTYCLKKCVDNWRDSVRDEIYLRGEVLHNLD
jgi:hypothetical protein